MVTSAAEGWSPGCGACDSVSARACMHARVTRPARVAFVLGPGLAGARSLELLRLFEALARRPYAPGHGAQAHGRLLWLP